MNKIRFLQFGVPILISMVGLNCPAGSSPDIKIGFMVPQTGSESGEAKLLTNAFNLALRQINDGGGINGKKLEVLVLDTKSTPQSAFQAYSKLVDEEKVTAVIAPSKSAELVALIPKMKQAGVPTFIGGTNSRLTSETGWFFRTRPKVSIAVDAMVKFLKEDPKVKKIGIIHDNGAFGMEGAGEFQRLALESGLKVVKRVGFAFGEKNFGPILKGFKDAGADAMIVMVSNPDEAASIQLAHAEMGKPFLYLGSASSQSEVDLAKAKDAAEKAYAAVDFLFGQSPVDAKYSADYKAQYHEDPDPTSTYAYDSVMLLADALRAVGEDPGKIRQHILGVKNYRGVQGVFSFTPNGDGLHSVTIIQIQHGQPKLFKVFSSNSQ